VDARLTNVEIAQRLHTSEPTIRRRINRLLANGSIRIVAVASPFDLGFEVMAVLGVKVNCAELALIGEALSAMEEVRFVGVTLGAYDLVAEAWLESREALITFLSERLAKLPGVKDVEPIQVLKLLKYGYDWGRQPSASLPPAR
jgi:Lrp/AsnC family transcriptional regulator for asnA, asnC and gidA